MRLTFTQAFCSLATFAACDSVLAVQSQGNSACLPKYRLLAERNSAVPMQAALCSATQTIHEFATREYPDQRYEFHNKYEKHQSELVVHVPFHFIQMGLSTELDKNYTSYSGYSNNSKSDQTTRSDTAYIGMQWTANLNTTFAYQKQHVYHSYDRERLLPSLSYRPFGWLLNLNASFLVEDRETLAKLAAFAALTDSQEIGLIIQPVFDHSTTTQKEIIHTYRSGYTLQSRLTLQENKGNPNYRSLKYSDGLMLSEDLSFEILEKHILGAALSYASYKKFSSTDTIYPDDFSAPPSRYPATQRGYGWGLALNYSYIL